MEDVDRYLFSKLPSGHIFVLDNWTLTQPDTRETKTGKLICQLEEGERCDMTETWRQDNHDDGGTCIFSISKSWSTFLTLN